MDKELTTHGDENEEEITSYDEPTNCRLRGIGDEELGSAIYGNNLCSFNPTSSPIVRPHEIEI